MARVTTCLHNFWLDIENWEMLILMMKNKPNDHKLNCSYGCKSIDEYHANEDGVVLWYEEFIEDLNMFEEDWSYKGMKVLLQCICQTTCSLGGYKSRSYFFLTQLLFNFQICTYLSHCKFNYNFLLASNFGILLLLLFLNLLLDWKKGTHDDLHFSRV
jgi:hypothetical protein